jgi:hypothetical protein
MISRRATLLGLVAASPISTKLEHATQLSFRVMRNGKPIGTHAISIEPAGEGFDVHIAVDIAYSIGPITLYRYTLRGLEQWRGGQLVRLDAHTDDDGTANFASAVRQGQDLWVTGSASAGYRAPPNALPGTHWNRNELDGPWINPQDGKLLTHTVADAGPDSVALADGSRVGAERFVVNGDVRMELWYTADRRWVSLRAPARDGSTILYDPI